MKYSKEWLIKEEFNRQLRHNKPESTMTYLKILIEDLKKDITKIDIKK
jgi:hypothetical protein